MDMKNYEEISVETFGRMLDEMMWGTEEIEVRIHDTSNLVLNTWYTIHEPEAFMRDNILRICSDAFSEDDTLLLPMDKVSNIYRRKVNGGREITLKYSLGNTEIIYVLSYEYWNDDEEEKNNEKQTK